MTTESSIQKATLAWKWAEVVSKRAKEKAGWSTIVCEPYSGATALRVDGRTWLRLREVVHLAEDRFECWNEADEAFSTLPFVHAAGEKWVLYDDVHPLTDEQAALL